MFGNNKRSVFKPSLYEISGRRSRRVPRWLILLLFGVVIGAGGLLFLQTSYGPQRLTVLESQQLTNEVNSAAQERLRLQNALDAALRDLATEREARQRMADELADAQTSVAPLKQEIDLFAAVMPADPRGGPIGVNAASFTRKRGELGYHVLIMQDEPVTQTFKGTLDMAVEGRHANGRAQIIALPPLELTLNRYQHLTGVEALPEGFTATRITVRVVDPAGRQRAMRILIPRNG